MIINLTQLYFLSSNSFNIGQQVLGSDLTVKLLTPLFSVSGQNYGFRFRVKSVNLFVRFKKDGVVHQVKLAQR
jgi:hypothetical protein